MTGAWPGGLAWGVVATAMLAVLVVVFVRQLRRSGNGSGRLVAIGVGSGLLLVVVALLLADRG